MQGEFGWTRPAQRYLKLYAELTDAKPARRVLENVANAKADAVAEAPAADSAMPVVQRRRAAARTPAASQATQNNGAWTGNAAGAHEDLVRRA
jgi:starch synthase